MRTSGWRQGIAKSNRGCGARRPRRKGIGSADGAARHGGDDVAEDREAFYRLVAQEEALGALLKTQLDRHRQMLGEQG